MKWLKRKGKHSRNMALSAARVFAIITNYWLSAREIIGIGLVS